MRQMDEEELAVIAEVARMYYVEGMSQADIADMLFFSKAKVSRALRIAREEHIVEFQVIDKILPYNDQVIFVSRGFRFIHTCMMDRVLYAEIL